MIYLESSTKKFKIYKIRRTEFDFYNLMLIMRDLRSGCAYIWLLENA